MHFGRLALVAALAGSTLLISPRASASDADDSKPDTSAEKSSDKDTSEKDSGDKASASDTETDDPELLIPRGPRTPEEQELDRYAYLSAEIARVQAPTERWYAGWTLGFAGIAVSQYSFAAYAPNDGLRELGIVGAVTATLAFGSMLIQPNTLAGAREKLESADTTMPQGIYERRRRAEYYLRSTTAEEKYWHGPVPMVLSAIISAAGGAILWAGYNNEVAGIADFAAGIALTALQMITRPSAATAAWMRYSQRYHPTTPTAVPPDQIDMFLSRVTFAPSPMGGSIGMTF